MLKIANPYKRFLSTTLACLLILSALFVGPMPANAYTAEDLGLRADTVYNFDDESKTAVTDYGTYVNGTDNGNYLSTKSAITDKSLLVWSTGSGTDSTLLFDAYSDIETFSFDIKMYSTANSVNVVYYYNPDTDEYSALNVYYANNTMQIAPIRYSDKYPQTSYNLVSWTATNATETWYTIKLTYGTEYSEATDTGISSNTVNSKYITNITVTDPDGNVVANASGATNRWKRSFAYGVDLNVDATATEPENVKVGFIDGGTRHMYIDNMVVTYRNAEKVQKLIDDIGTIEYTPECLAKIEKAEAAYNLLSDTQKAKITYDFEAAYDEYYELGKAALGLHSDTVYDFNDESKTAVTNYGSYVNGTDNSNYLSTKSAITDKSLLVWSTGSGTDSTLLFDAYSNIKTYSFDIKMYSTANSVNVVYYYNPDTDEYSALNVYYANNTMQIAPIRYSDKYPQTSYNLVSWTATNATETWYTIKLTYGTEYSEATDTGISSNTVNSKYITNITVTDADGNVVANESGATNRWKRSFAYGVDLNANPDATEPENVKVGFIDGGTRHMYIDNMTVTYRNVDKVQALIDQIGEIEYTDECLANIEKAEAAYDLLSDTEKAEITYDFDAAYDEYYELGRAAVGLHSDTVYDFNDESKTAVTDYGTYVNGTDNSNYLSTKSAITDKSLLVWSTGSGTDSTLLFDAYSNIETFSFDIKMYSTANSVNVVYYYNPDTDEYSALNVHYASGVMQIAPIRYSDKYPQTSFKLVTWECTDATEAWYTIKLTYGTEYAEATDTGISSNTVNSKYLTNITVTDADGNVVANESGATNRWKRSFAYGVDLNADATATEPENVKVGFIDGGTRHMYIDNMVVTYDDVATVKKLIADIGYLEDNYTEEGLAKIEKAEAAYNFLSAEEQKGITYDFAAAKEECSSSLAAINAVKALIADIGEIEYTDECLANIQAAEAAFDELTDAQKEYIDYDFAAAYEEYESLSGNDFGIKEQTVYDFNDETKTLSDYATIVNGSDGTSKFGNAKIEDKTLLAWSNGAVGSKILFPAGSGIRKYSFDIKMKDTSNGVKVVYFYDADNGNYSAIDISYAADSTNGGYAMTIKPVDHSNTNHNVINYTLATWNSAAPTETWYTITLTYGDTYEQVTYNSFSTKTVISKHLTNITVTETESGTEKVSADMTEYSSYKRATAYGVDRTNDETLTDSENIMVGFMDNGSRYMYVDNMTVTYRNVEKVQALIDAIGEIDGSDECYARIEKAEEAYNLLSDDEKAEITYDFAGNKEYCKAYNGIKAVQDLVDAIGEITADPDCLARIEEAEAAYNELDDKYKSYIDYDFAAAKSKYNVANCQALVDAIGEIVYTDECLANLDAAKAAYDALSDDEQAQINYDFDGKYAKYNSLKAVAEVQALVDAIGEITADPACLERIAAAEVAYNELSDTEKAQIDYDFAAKREQHYSLVRVADCQALVDAIGEIEYTDECLANIQAAENAYNALSESEQAQIDYDFEKAYAEYEAKKSAAFGIYADTVYNFDDETKTNVTDYGTYVNGTDDSSYLSAKSAITDKSLLVWSTGNGTNSTLLFDAYSDIETFSFDIKMYSTANSVNICYYYNPNTNEYSALCVYYANGQMQIAPLRYGDKNPQTSYKLVTWDCTDATEAWYTVKLTYGTEYVEVTDTTMTSDGVTKATVNSKYITNITVTDANGNVVANESGTTNRWKRSFAYGVDLNVDATATEPENVKVGFIDGGTRHMYIDNMTVTYRNVDKVQALIDAIGEIDGTDECYARIEKAEEAYDLLSDDEKAEITYDFAGNKEYCKVYAAVKPVQDKIDAIGEIVHTDECLAKLNDAKAAFDNLTDAQKEYIDYNFEEAYAKYNSLGELAEIQALIDAIGTIDGTDECYIRIQNAENAYNELTEEQQALIVYDFDKAYSDWRVAYVQKYIDAIGEIEYTDACKQKLDDAKGVYDELTAEEQARIDYDFDAAYAEYNAAKGESYGIRGETVYNFDDETKTNVTDYGTYVNGTDDSSYLSAKSAITDKSLLVWSTGNGTNSTLLFDAYSDIETFSFDVKMYSTANSVNICYYYNPNTNEYSALSVHYADGVMQIAPCRYGDKNPQNAYKLVTWECTDATEAWYTVKLTYGTDYVEVTDTTMTSDGVTKATVNSKYITNITVTDADGNEVVSVSGNTAKWARSFAYGVDLNADATATEPENIKIGFIDGGTRHMYIDNMVVTYRNVDKVQALINDIGEIDGTDECYAKIQKAEDAYSCLNEAEQAQIDYDFEWAYEYCEAYPHVESVQKLISAIGTITADEACLTRIETAEAAYNALDAKYKKYIDYDFAAAHAEYEYLVEYDNILTLIDRIGEIEYTDECIRAIEKAEVAYNNLTAEQQAVVGYDFEAAKEKYHDLAVKAWQDTGVHGNTVFNFNDGKALSNYSEKVDTNDNGTTKDIDQVTIVDGALKLDGNTNASGTVSDEYSDALFFDAYSNIDTFSIDLKINELQNGHATPRIVYYYNGNGWYSAFYIRYLNNTFYLEPSNGAAYGSINAGYVPQDMTAWGASDVTDGWVTIKLTYGTTVKQNKDSSFSPATVNSKYLESVQIIDRATGSTIISLSISDLEGNSTANLFGIPTKARRMFSYGVGSNGESGTTEPAKVQVGFISNYDSPVYADNMTITYRDSNAAAAAVNMINELPATFDNTYVCLTEIRAMKEAYDSLTATDKANVTNAAALDNAVSVADAIESVDTLPEILGASVRKNDDPEKQNLAFLSSLEIKQFDGWKPVQYGMVMLPYRSLGENNDLTFNISGIAHAYSDIDLTQPLPENWVSELQGINFNDKMCSVAIAARSYVKYTDGTNTFYIYSKNEISNPVKDYYVGTSLRSVYSTARTIAKAVVNTALYPVDTYGAITYTNVVTEGMTDLSTVSGKDLLEFIYQNSRRITKIAQAQF